MTMWDYTSVATSKHRDLTKQLGKLGGDGWELVSVVLAGIQLIAFLKRPRE